MNVYLMAEAENFDIRPAFSPQQEELTADLQLDKVFAAMAKGDEHIEAAARAALLVPLKDERAILYRQSMLEDCVRQAENVRALYALAQEALESRKKERFWLTSCLSSLFDTSVNLMKRYLEFLKKLRQKAEAAPWQAAGFVRFSGELSEAVDDDFLRRPEALLEELSFRDGVTASVRLGRNNRIASYTLVRSGGRKDWLKWKLAPAYQLAARDDAGAKDLAYRVERAMESSMDTLSQAAVHIEHFFGRLRDELAFYVGALNLRETLLETGTPLCRPEFSKEGRRSFSGLCDISLPLTGQKPVGNALDCRDKRLLIITGANQGGKTTFLRSLGQAQLMAQAGLFAAAEAFCCPIRQGVFTHFKREEDENMKSGKLDEELRRMDALVPLLRPGTLMLFNESFAATNEREGSQLCSQITRALLEHGIEIAFVTHFYTFAHQFAEMHREDFCFLRAQRLADGTRTFRLEAGEPLETAYGQDLYRKIWGGGAIAQGGPDVVS